MNLSSKHQQRVVTYGNFTGGLNTTTVPEMIAENQMAECINMEFNRSTGALQTVNGTATIFKAVSGIVITNVFYDSINNIFLIVDNSGNVYKSNLTDVSGTKADDLTLIGTLNGTVSPVAVIWEFGVLIASGGQLQYWDGSQLTTLENSPKVCNGVFVKNGRVYVWYDYRLQCSAAGDETTWDDDSNDDSTSKWVDIGYKEGENEQAYILGVTALSSDIIIIKNDGKVYRLSGEYPDWSINEITRFGKCLNSRCYAAVQDAVFILDRHNLVCLQTTMNYGDIKPENIAINVRGLLNDLDLDNSVMEFIPQYNQLWITSRGGDVLVYDITFKAFIQRTFKNRIVDFVTNYHDAVLLVRSDKVTRIMEGMYTDETYSSEAHSLAWSVVCKSSTDFYSFLLKRIRMAYVPFSEGFDSAYIVTAKGKINIPIPERSHIDVKIIDDNTPIANCTDLVYPSSTQFKTSRMVYRNITLDMKLEGSNAPMMINKIECAVTEVG